MQWGDQGGRSTNKNEREHQQLIELHVPVLKTAYKISTILEEIKKKKISFVWATMQ